MASATNATIPSKIQHCRHCGACRPLRSDGHCSTSCMNRSRADHSEETLMRRFAAKVDKTPGFGPKGDCWRWTARLDGRGYGEIKVAGRYRKAHRLALFGLSGMNSPLFACHRCDNPQCVNPDHLFPGEAVVNVRDMIEKGRARGGRGGAGRKLSPEQVSAIRASTAPHVDEARKHGVTEMVIFRIRRRMTYRDVA